MGVGRGRQALVAWLMGVVLAAPAMAAVSYGQDSGLPSQIVEALALDERGFLWVGTQDGLARFDSHRFLPVDLAYGQAVVDPKVARLLAVAGAVYVATPRRLHRYDQRDETLSPVHADGQELVGVIDLAADADGSIHAVTQGGQLYRWRDTGSASAPERVALDTAAPLPRVVTLGLGRESIWLGTTQGVYRVDRNSLKTERLSLDLPEIQHGAVHVSALTEDAGGELWIGFWNDGLARYRPQDGRLRRLLPGTPEAGALRSTSIYRFLHEPGGMVIATNRGLVIYRRDCDCLHGLNHPDWDKVEGSGIIASDVVAEPGGAVWAGVWGTGLVRFSATDRVFERQVRVDGRHDALAHPIITSLRADTDGRLWIGSYGGGIQWVDAAARRGGEFWPLNSLPWGERRVESRFVWSMELDRDELLIGTGHGLLAWSMREQRMRDINPDQASIRSSLALGDGSHLIGTVFGLYRERARAMEPVLLSSENELGPPAQAAWSLASWHDEIWVGSARGLWRLDRELAVRAHHDVGPENTQLPGPVVWTQKTDAQGRHWLGTSGGLVEVRREIDGPRFVRHARSEGTGSQSVGSIEFDRLGQLWLGTPQGLVRYRPATGERRVFDASDGLISDQLNTNASTNDGQRLYFGGVGGLIAFDPLAIPEPEIALHPQVVQLRLGQGAWQPPSALTLERDHPSLHVELSAHHFEHPEQVRYAYRWSPGEAGFTELGDARSAVFSRLPSGKHQLELRASLTDDPTAAAIDTVLDVTVRPAWHETWWGRAGLLLGLASLGYAVMAGRSRQIRQQAQALARVVRERTQELSAAKDALELANVRLQSQASTDPLTGLDNRRRLFDVAAQLQRQGRNLAVVLIDLDYFKRINDEHGHQTGDTVLSDFADVMRATFGDNASCSRYGGEEFLALVDESEGPALTTLAEQLLERVRTRRIASATGVAVGYTASIGIARGLPGESFESLIRRADQALYRAKETGRNRYVLA